MEKKYIKTAVLFLSIFLNAICLSCDGYLEKPPGVDVTEDTIFSSPIQIDYFVAGTYFMGVKMCIRDSIKSLLSAWIMVMWK